MSEPSNLDDRIKVPSSLENELKFKEGRRYTARFSDLKMAGGAIYGDVALSRNNYQTKHRKRLVLIREFPPHFESRWVPYEDYDPTNNWYCNRENCLLIDSKGQLAIGDESYKQRMRDDAFRKGVVIKDELLDTIFKPLEEELKKLFQEYTAKLNSSGSQGEMLEK